MPFDTITTDLLDIDPGSLLDSYSPDVVLHCAALADIDQCEKFPEKAETINGFLPGKFAAAAHKRGIKIIHISTDAVFDGENCGEDGYCENDLPNPISKYAETKLIGEKTVADNDPDALIVRVNFYGWSITGNRSLVEFFYNNLSLGNQVNGFGDVFFSTLYVHSLAKTIDEMIELDAYGIYHVFSSDYQSKYSFGISIAKKFGFDPCLVKEVSWKDGGLSARRSPNLIMNTEKTRVLLGHDLPNQKDCLDLFFEDSTKGLRQKIQGYAYS